MNKKEAKEIIADELKKYRALSYDELVGMIGNPAHYELEVPSGINYQIEIEVFWDDKPNGNIRVIGSIDDGGIRAFVPITDAFIKNVSGDFIGE